MSGVCVCICVCACVCVCVCVSVCIFVHRNPSRALDACGVCGGSNSTCAGCDGVPNRSPTIPPLHNRNPLPSLSHAPTAAEWSTCVACAAAATQAARAVTACFIGVCVCVYFCVFVRARARACVCARPFICAHAPKPCVAAIPLCCCYRC